MRRLTIASLLIAVGVSLGNQQPAQRSTVLNHVTVVNGTSAPAKDMSVVISGNRIAAVEAADRIQIPAGALVLDLSGKYVIPGIADMHNHLFAGGPIPTLEDLKPNLQRLLAFGVTTTFSMSTDNMSFADLKRVAADDTSPYPRFYGVGPGFATFGGYRPNTPAEAREQVRRLKSENVDAIKIAYDDMSWVTRQKIPVLKQDVMAAIIAESHANGLKVYVHAPLLSYAKDVLRAGADGLVHGIISDPVDDEFIDLMKKNRAVYISTLSLYEACADMRAWTKRLVGFDQKGLMKSVWTLWENPASMRQFQAIYDGTDYVSKRLPVVRANLKRVSQEGISIVTGTDTGFSGVVLGASSLMELVLHVEAGLSPQTALRAATLNAAAMAGVEKEFGTVEAGKRSDLVVLEADPLADISNVRKIYRVIKGGVVYAF